LLPWATEVVSKGILSMITEKDTQTTAQKPVNPMIIEVKQDPFASSLKTVALGWRYYPFFISSCSGYYKSQTRLQSTTQFQPNGYNTSDCTSFFKLNLPFDNPC
jgi:hypothetical protein